MPEKEKRKLHNTTISSSSHTTDRLWVIKHRLGLRPLESQKKRQSRDYSHDEIINMALDALERELAQGDSPISK